MNIRINNNPQDIDLTISIMQAMLPQAVKETRQMTNSIIGHYPDDMAMALARSIWSFMKKEFKYKADPIGQELIRMPSVSWKVRKSGIDCEDYSLMIAAICQNLDVKCRYRIVDYNGMGWSHIYVIATNKIGREFTIDPVHETFNHQDAFVKFKDFEVLGRKTQLGKTMKKVRFRTYKTVGLGRIGVDPATARQNGCFTDAGNKYCRQKIVSKVVLGRKTKVSFTFDQVIDCQYIIMSADDLQPSHLGNIENPMHFLPEAQPRNRATSESGADTPRRIAAQLRPSEIVEGANAYTGAPIVNHRGEVIQGNGRAFALKVYWENFANDPQGYTAYLDQMKDYLGIPNYISFSPKGSVNSLKTARFPVIEKPVLVRMVQVTDTEAIKLGQYKQGDLEAIATRSNEIKSKVNLIDDRKLSRLLDNVFAQADPDDSLSEIIRKTNLLTQMVRLGILRSDQLEEYAKNGTVNARGIAYVADILLFVIFKGSDVNTPEIFSQLPVRIQNAIMKATPSLLRVDDDKQIKLEVSNAILATRDFINSGASNVASWEKQTSMFLGTPKEQFSDFERELVKLFTTASSQKQIVEAFEKYANAVTDQAPDLISEGRKGLSKAEGIRFAFFGENPKVSSQISENSRTRNIRILKLKYKYTQ
jgi:hypothetical protein